MSPELDSIHNLVMIVRVVQTRNCEGKSTAQALVSTADYHEHIPHDGSYGHVVVRKTPVSTHTPQNNLGTVRTLDRLAPVDYLGPYHPVISFRRCCFSLRCDEPMPRVRIARASCDGHDLIVSATVSSPPHYWLWP